VRSRAAAGDAVAQFSLGSLLYYGEDHLRQAVDWFRKAAAQGYAPASFRWGSCTTSVWRGCRRRPGVAWYRKAAEHGARLRSERWEISIAEAAASMANATEAVRWYLRAADGDDLRAQYQLGQMYFDGTAVTRDYVSAYVWFDIAAGQTPARRQPEGDPRAAQHRGGSHDARAD
jgi:TPR repeat protein